MPQGDVEEQVALDMLLRGEEVGTVLGVAGVCGTAAPAFGRVDTEAFCG